MNINRDSATWLCYDDEVILGFTVLRRGRRRVVAMGQKQISPYSSRINETQCFIKGDTWQHVVQRIYALAAEVDPLGEIQSLFYINR